MRYEFGFLDHIQFLLHDTVMDCVPHFTVKLKEDVDVVVLKNAIDQALEKHLVFKTKLVLDKKYFLETNDSEVIIEKSENLIKHFGKTTNGYLWRVTYNKNLLEFDICHGLTDGRGMARFVLTVLEYYFDQPCSYKTEQYIDAYSQIYDKNVKSYGIKKQPKGFSKKELSHIKDGLPTELNFISFKTMDLMRVAKKFDSTPAALLLPLISKAIRMSLPMNKKNRNVNMTLTADFRKAMNMENGRNFVGMFPITYTDKFDKFDLEYLSTIYRGIIDLRLQEENIVAYCSETLDSYKIINKMPGEKLSHSIVKIATKLFKKDTNGYLTYIGKLNLNEELIKHIEDFNMILYPDTGFCTLAALDFNGVMKLCFTNNYKTKEIVPNLIKILEEQGINATCSETILYNQSRLIL